MFSADRNGCHHQKKYIEEIVNRFRVDDFPLFFHLSQVSTECILEWIGFECLEDGIQGITDREGSGGSAQKPLEHWLLMVLYFLVTQDRYIFIADRFGMSEGTANCVTHHLLMFIQEHLLESIVWPTAEEQAAIAEHYMELLIDWVEV